MRYLMGYLKVLFQDYRDELSEILAADPRLAREIEYDLRKFDDQEKAAAAMAEFKNKAKNQQRRVSAESSTPTARRTSTPLTGRSKHRRRHSFGATGANSN